FSRMSVNHRPQPLRFRFAAYSHELFVGHRLAAAVADALRREYLNDIGAVGLQLADEVAELIRRPAVLVELADRSEDARSGQDAARDGFTQRDIRRRAHALNGGEPGHQGRVSVLRRVIGLLLGSL